MSETAITAPTGLSPRPMCSLLSSGFAARAYRRRGPEATTRRLERHSLLALMRPKQPIDAGVTAPMLRVRARQFRRRPVATRGTGGSGLLQTAPGHPLGKPTLVLPRFWFRAPRPGGRVDGRRSRRWRGHDRLP